MKFQFVSGLCLHLTKFKVALQLQGALHLFTLSPVMSHISWFISYFHHHKLKTVNLRSDVVLVVYFK